MGVTILPSSFTNKFDEMNSQLEKIANSQSTVSGGIADAVNLANEATQNVEAKITDVENRFTTLTVTQQQDSEVIEARKGEVSLGAKMDSVDAQIADIKEKTYQATLKNIFKGGDFTSQSPYWSTVGMNNIEYSKEGFITALVSTRFGIQGNHDFIKGHKYLVSFYHKHSAESDKGITFRLYPVGNNYDYLSAPLIELFPSTVKDKVVICETILTMDDEYDKFEIAFFPNEEYILEIGYVLIVDLTTEFGIGKEPTLEEFKIISPFWFDGCEFVEGLQNKSLLLKSSELQKEVESTSKVMEDINGFIEVLDEGGIYKFRLPRGRNYSIRINDESDKHISFRDVHEIKEKMITRVIRVVFDKLANLNFPPNISWQEGVKPTFIVGRSYVLLFQSFDAGRSWLGTVSGYWETGRLIVSDDFNRADNATSLGSASTGHLWHSTPITVWGIRDNKACVYVSRSDVVSNASDIAYLDSGVSDCMVSARFMNTTQQNRIAVRLRDDNNYISVGRLGAEGGERVAIFIIEGGVQSILTSVLLKESYGVGDKLSVLMRGDKIDVYYNDVLYITRTSEFNKAETKHGLISFQATDRYFDDFSVEVI